MPDSLVDKNERLVLIICAVYSGLVYLLLLVTIFGIGYVLLFALFFAITQGIALGHLRGNGVRVTESQFPSVYRFAGEIAERMRLSTMPDIYIVQEGGILNAFATRFFGRNFVVIYSDILELAIEQGEAAVAFVVAHEMAHLYRKHTLWKSMLYPAMIVPMLGVLYSRCCEYTADAIGAACVPNGAGSGLLVLAAGKHLYRHVDPVAFVAQADEAHKSFWITVAELFSTHPILPKRLMRVGQLLATLDVRESTASSMAAV